MCRRVGTTGTQRQTLEHVQGQTLGKARTMHGHAGTPAGTLQVSVAMHGVRLAPGLPLRAEFDDVASQRVSKYFD